MIELEEQSKDIYILNDIEKKLLEQSRKELEAGKFSTHEEVMDRLKKWPEKK